MRDARPCLLQILPPLLQVYTPKPRTLLADAIRLPPCSAGVLLRQLAVHTGSCTPAAQPHPAIAAAPQNEFLILHRSRFLSTLLCGAGELLLQLAVPQLRTGTASPSQCDRLHPDLL